MRGNREFKLLIMNIIADNGPIKFADLAARLQQERTMVAYRTIKSAIKWLVKNDYLVYDGELVKEATPPRPFQLLLKWPKEG